MGDYCYSWQNYNVTNVKHSNELLSFMKFNAEMQRTAVET
jgi:hypothetical protein